MNLREKVKDYYKKEVSKHFPIETEKKDSPEEIIANYALPIKEYSKEFYCYDEINKRVVYLLPRPLAHRDYIDKKNDSIWGFPDVVGFIHEFKEEYVEPQLKSWENNLWRLGELPDKGDSPNYFRYNKPSGQEKYCEILHESIKNISADYGLPVIFSVDILKEHTSLIIPQYTTEIFELYKSTYPEQFPCEVEAIGGGNEIMTD